MLGYVRVSPDSTTFLSFHGVLGVLGCMGDSSDSTAILLLVGGLCFFGCVGDFTGLLFDFLFLMGLRVGALSLATHGPGMPKPGHARPSFARRGEYRACGLGQAVCWGPCAAAHRPH